MYKYNKYQSKYLTQKVAKPGCIPQKLDIFLSLKNDKERRKKYGNDTTVQYYGRIVKQINASFQDHKKAIDKLPDEYLKKIKFEKYYESITSIEVFRKWTDQPPDKFLEEVTSNVNIFYHNLENHPRIKKLAKEDFEKVLDWLYVMQEMQKKGIKNL